MALINNIVKISKNSDGVTSSYIEDELFKMGFVNILRWAIVEVSDDFYKINFCNVE